MELMTEMLSIIVTLQQCWIKHVGQYGVGIDLL